MSKKCYLCIKNRLKASRYYIIVDLVILLMLNACGSTKFVPDGAYLLSSVEIKSDSSDVDVSKLYPYIRQKANAKWFSLLKIPLGTYSLSGKDSTRWINRTLQHMGEKPVVYDTLDTRQSIIDLHKALLNMGYMHAGVSVETEQHKRKIKVIYLLHPGRPSYLSKISYDIQDHQIKKILENYKTSIIKDRKTDIFPLKSGDRFILAALEEERQRITNILLDSGYYKFHKDYITFTADSATNSNKIGLILHIRNYQRNNNIQSVDHPRYKIGDVSFFNEDGSIVRLRNQVLHDNTEIHKGDYFSLTNAQKTYNNFGRLQAIKYANISFHEIPDTNVLNCNVQLSLNKPSTLAFQPEGTNTAGDLGAAASLIYENRNLFKGSELLSLELRGAYEAITGLEGYNDENYIEYGAQAKLQFPQFIAPFLSKNFRQHSHASSELALSWDLQNRPEFHRRVLSAVWRYRWSDIKHETMFHFEPLDLNYVYMPWISQTFKHDYLDSVSNRNAILRYNYENLFILKLGFGLSYSNGTDAIKANIETAGNLLHAFAYTFSFKRNNSGQFALINDIAFAQYCKFDIDYTHLRHIDEHNTMAFHVALGIAYPYGNSKVLPFEKRYFSGGANSVRGWSVRELGPGSYRGKDGRIDFINQTGDVKLDINLEYRTLLFWKLNGALFLDGGNIWTLRNYEEQPGGQFKFNEFYKQIALSYGAGLRLNFNYFILRFDFGMKAVNPAWTTESEHWAIFHPNIKRDLTFHFAVGLPF